MRSTASVLCNNIIYRAKRDSIKITPMKLQKLLYYVCVVYARKTGKSPISEQFEVWKYGPVLPSVYAEFSPFGSSPITSYALNAKKEAKMVDEDYNPILKECLDSVWGELRDYSGIELSRRTHQSGSGWYSAYQNDIDVISTEEMINDATI